MVLSMVVFQSVLLFVLIYFKGFSIDSLLFPAIIGIFLKLLALLVLILFFSTFVSPIIAMFLTIASYIIGHGGYSLLDYAGWEGSKMALYMGKLILVIFPNLESLNLKNYVATQAPLHLSDWYMAFGMSVLYTATLLFLGAWIFSKKSFDDA